MEVTNAVKLVSNLTSVEELTSIRFISAHLRGDMGSGMPIAALLAEVRHLITDHVKTGQFILGHFTSTLQ